MKLRSLLSRASIKRNFISLKVGMFLAIRDIRRASKWTTILIIFVMMLTFLNLVVVRGILVGLIEGSIKTNREHYTGDIFIEQIDKNQFIKNSQLTVGILKSIPSVVAVSARYTTGGMIVSDYKTRIRRDDKPDAASAVVTGINPGDEDAATGLSRSLIAGRYLDESRKDEILVGRNLLTTYNPASFTGLTKLRNGDIGSTVLLTINGFTKEVKIVGVVKAKVNAVDNRIFMLDRELRTIMGREDYNVNEIAVKARNSSYDTMIKDIAIGNGIDRNGIVRTAVEAQPQFLKDVTATFDILGNVIGTIGLAVASITIFIVIFVNAITRRKYIGILKGIGVSGLAIEISYILQSVFYAVGGTVSGLLVVYGFLLPYFLNNPIDFPFSDGILVADIESVGIRIAILMVATVFAGYIPSRIVVKGRTLDAILGR